VNQWVKKYQPGKKPHVPTPINLESDNTILIAKGDSQVLLVDLPQLRETGNHWILWTGKFSG
jgi:hypothetical protein